MAVSVKHPPSSVGEHTIKIPSVFLKSDTASKVLSALKKDQDVWPNTEFIYVVDTTHKLIGVIPFRKIVTASPQTLLENLMQTDFPYLSPHAHQETAAKLAIKEKLENIPVVDQDGVFIGIVSTGEIFKILHESHTDKLMHFSGILLDSNTNSYKESISVALKLRVPWLTAGLAGGIGSTYIVSQFSNILQQQLALAFFIPVIVYMNDAVGTQTQTVYVRNAAFGKIDIKKALIFELKLSVLIGTIMGMIISIYAYFRHSNILLGFAIGISMAMGILSSAIIGTIIPWLIEKSGRDPAIGSGPFTTIIQDIISIMIYFSIASLLL